MTEFNPQLGTSLKLLWNMGHEGLSGFCDPPFSFNSGRIEEMIRRKSRVPFDTAEYLNGMSTITALVIGRTETQKRRIEVIGQSENEAWGPPSLRVHLDPDDAGVILECDIVAMPATTHYQEPAAGLRIARVPLAVLAAEAEGTLSEELYNEAGLPDVKFLVDEVGGLVIRAMLRSGGPDISGGGVQGA